MLIKNTRDLRLAYELLNILEQHSGVTVPKIVELKQKIRAFSNGPAPQSRIVKDYGMDGYIAIQQLPDFTDSYTLDEATEYFQDVEVIEPPCSWYDCTGRPMTNWFKIFRRRGHWFAYHSVSFDV